MPARLMFGSDRPEPTAEPVVKAFPDGHYYSPIPDLAEVEQRYTRVFDAPDSLPGVDLATERQLRLLPDLAAAAVDVPFTHDGSPGLRYKYDNNFFGPGDAVGWYAMLRHVRPRRVVEVGSGWSSAVLLDTIDLTPGLSPELTFIEPDPQRLHELLREDDEVEIVEALAQDLPPDTFLRLGAGDVLFIDSSHVAKVGSDVHRLLLEVLPRLAPGVIVHLHDIFYPFQYPADWVYMGFAWNEAYMLRALLTHSDRFEIVWWAHYLATFHHDVVAAALPDWGRGPGASIYLRATAGGKRRRPRRLFGGRGPRGPAR